MQDHVRRVFGRAVVVSALLAGCSAHPAGGATTAAATATGAGPDTVAGWQALYDALPYRGDGNFSARLTDGRSIWVTGDAIPRAGGTWAANTVTVVDGISSWQTPDVIATTPDGVRSWLGPVALSDGKVIALVSRVKHTPGVWPGFASVGTAVATMSIGSGAWWPTVERVTATPWSASSVNWTAGLYADGSALYVFGTRQAGWEHEVYLARVPAASVHDQTAWRYWVAPCRWSASLGAAAPILTGGTDSAFSVRKDTAGWHLYTRHAGAHGEWVGGPGRWRWVPRGSEAGYLPASHPEVPVTSGGLLVTVNGDAAVRFLEVPR